MSKDKKRGNREVRKPKAAKPVATLATAPVLTLGSSTPLKLPKKKT